MYLLSVHTLSLLSLQPIHYIQVTQLNGAFRFIDVKIVMRDNGICNSVMDLLPNGQLWYAYFNGNEFSNNCCGTATYRL